MMKPINQPSKPSNLDLGGHELRYLCKDTKSFANKLHQHITLILSPRYASLESRTPAPEDNE